MKVTGEFSFKMKMTGEDDGPWDCEIEGFGSKKSVVIHTSDHRYAARMAMSHFADEWEDDWFESRSDDQEE